MKEAIFLITALITVGSALYVAFSRNLIYSAFALLLTLSGVAGLYVFVGADFLAGIQLLLYVGGVLVITIFAIMLSAEIDSSYRTNPARSPWIAATLLLLFLAAALYAIWNIPWPENPLPVEPTTNPTGEALLTTYILPFELISLLLLVGLIGAIGVLRPTLQRNEHSNNPESETHNGSANNGAKQ